MLHTRRSRRGLRLGRVVRPFVGELLEPRRLLAAVSWDGGGDGTSWTDPLNWDTDALPTSADDVTIDIAANPTIQITGTQTVNSVTSAERTEIVGGSLDVNAASTFTDLLVRGFLSGSGDITVTNTLELGPAEIQGTGDLIIASTATAAVTVDAANFRRNVINAGTFNQIVRVRFFDGATFTNLAGAVYNAEGGFVGQSGGVGTFVNQGTFNKTTNSTVDVAVPFDNTGTVNVNAGTLSLNGGSNIGSGGFLSSGRYLVRNGTTLSFNTPITTLTADIEIDGTGSVPQLTGLLVNRGRVGLTGGADLTLPATNPERTLVHEGILDLSPDSTFTVNGNARFDGVSQPVIRSEIASASSFGRVVITGSLDLNSPNSSSRFDPDLVNGYDPAIGTPHDVIVAAGGISNAFDLFQGGLTPSDNILLLTRPDANTVAVDVGPGPLPPPPQILGQFFDFETREAVVFQFDQDVSSFLTRKDYQILNLTTGQPVSQTAGVLTYNQTSNEAVLLLTGLLSDADYRLTINASDIANNAGVPASGTPIVLDFHVLAGDVNRDRSVGFADLLTLAQNYNETGRTFSQGNIDYSPDGLVGFSDLLILAQNYNASLIRAEPKPSVFASRTTTRRTPLEPDEAALI